MAQQGEQRARHPRQSSRILRFGSAGGEEQKARTGKDQHQHAEEATVKFIKRVLCANPAKSGTRADSSSQEVDSKPLDELLPPLTSSNEVDLQLYAIIAVILSQLVQSWYNRITPDDQFVAEIVQIIAHCTRGLEERLRHVDLEELLFDEIPALVVAHIDAVRVAQDACHESQPSDDLRRIYHTIRPNKALTPLPDTESTILEQQDNEIAWSQLLVSRVLPLVLPPEDLQNPCLHVLVSEIFSELIVHNAVCGKTTQPWLIWEGITKLIYSLRPDVNPQRANDAAAAAAPSPINKLEQFGLFSSANAVGGQDAEKAQHRRLDPIAQVLWATLQFVMVAWMLLRSLLTALMHAPSIPARRSRMSRMNESQDEVRIGAGRSDNPQHITPVVSMRVWTCISRLTDVGQRMPWLSGFLSLLQWLSLHGPGRLCSTNSVLDRLLASHLHTTLHNPSLLPHLLQTIRSTLATSSPRTTPPPTEPEIKRACAQAIIDTIPLRDRIFATTDAEAMRRDVEASVLDCFADAYVNRHLVVGVVELVVVRVFPELGVEGE